MYVRETWQYLYKLDGNEQVIEDTGKYYYAATDTISFNAYVDEKDFGRKLSVIIATEEAEQIAKDRALEDIDWNNCECDTGNPIVYCCYKEDSDE